MKNFKKIFLAATVASVCQSSIAADAYQLIDLSDAVGERNPSAVRAINNNGIVVGDLTGPIVEEQNSDDNTVSFLEYIRGFSTDGTNLIEFESFEDTNQTTEFSFSRGINDSGISAGSSTQEYEYEVETGRDENDNPIMETRIGDQRRAVTFDNTGVISVIPELMEEENFDMNATAINNNGLVVGTGFFNRADDVDANGEPTDAVSINGFAYDTNSENLVVIEPISNKQSIGIELYDVNLSGIAIGQSQEEVENVAIVRAVWVDTNNPESVAYIKPFNEAVSSARAINDDGIVVGAAADSTNRFFTSYAYNTNTSEVIDLGVLLPEVIDRALSARFTLISQANDINTLDDGAYQVVGKSLVTTKTVYNGTQTSGTRVAVYNAFLHENGTMKNLNDLIDCKQDGSEPVGEKDWELSEALAINNQGVIIGHGVNDGEVKPFMLVPKGAGEQPIPCVEEDKDDSGSGSISFIGLLLTPLVFMRRRFLKK